MFAAFRLVESAIEFARENKIENLLADTRNLTGFRSPNTWERFLMSDGFAQKAKGAVKLALIARPEMIDPQHVGVAFARNRGLMAEVFDSETAALKWLLDPRAE